MKRILIFGLGERGKKLIAHCLKYKCRDIIVAIIDNNIMQEFYCGIPVIYPENIINYVYDEIWVCTIYYPEIKKQLIEEYEISEQKIVYVEPVMPILEERLHKHYEKALNKKVEVSDELKEVLNYISLHHAQMYCYPFYDEYLNKMDVPVFFEESCQLFYVYYDLKKMYFSKKIDSERKVRHYFNLIRMEQDSRSPHCYWNEKKMEDVTGVGIDVGTSEGIFALKIIEQIEHIYLIEIDEDWIEALQYTFEPFKEKVTIIQGFASDKDDEQCIKLDSLIGERKIDFIKMDIEGEEKNALKGCSKILKNNNVELAICVYHNSEDNDQIGNFLIKQGYNIKNSKGYIVCQGEWELENKQTLYRSKNVGYYLLSEFTYL